MAHQAALVSIVKRVCIIRKFLCLADIMQQGPGHKHIHVQAWIRTGNHCSQLRNSQGVLKKSTKVCVVHEFCSWCPLEFFKKSVVSKEAVQQFIEKRILYVSG